MSSEEQQSGPVPLKPDHPRQDDAFSATVIRLDESGVQRGAESDRIVGITTSPGVTMPSGPESSDPAPVQPAAFGRYAVQRTLGAGSFGAVYLGHDAQLDRAVAIKVLHASRASSAAGHDQFLHEARKLAQLRHPGIVAVHDVGVHDGQAYVVADYLDGPDLGRWLRENRVTWPEAVRIAAAVADALAHAHEHLIVHRDVKPANIIMVTADRAPVLVDFGIALDDARAGGREKGVLSGTPWYMSPEQASGAAHRLDGRMDIYSLGVVLYEMLTSRVPFRSTNFEELLRQIRDDEPQPLRQLVRDIPLDLERICLKALAKRQPDRYGTAADFAEALRLVLATATASAFQHHLPAIQAPASELRATELSSSRSSALSSSSMRRRSREAEHRHVSVVVCGCDLFESDTYLQLDAEQQVGVLRSFQQACQQPLFELDGTVVQCNEQGLLACF